MERNIDSRSTGLCIHKDSSLTAQNTTRNHIRQRQTIHIQILAIPNGFNRHKTKTVNSIPPIDGWTNRKDKLNARTILTGIHQLLIKQLGRITTHRTIHI